MWKELCSLLSYAELSVQPPKVNVGLSDAGLYYCAVVACDEVLFGNGTTLVIEGKCIMFEKCNFLADTFLSKAT